jgi:hypothetical protein
MQQQNSLVTALRWVAFIPGGLLGGVVGGALALLFFGGGSWLAGMKFDAPINLFLAGGVSGYATVYCGAYVAPSISKKTPAVVVGSIMLLLAAAAIFIRLNNHEWLRSSEGLCLAIGVAIAMSQAMKDNLNA